MGKVLDDQGIISDVMIERDEYDENVLEDIRAATPADCTPLYIQAARYPSEAGLAANLPAKNKCGANPKG